VKGVPIARRFEALDVAAQRRKRAHACAHHAHCSQELRTKNFGLRNFDPDWFSNEPASGSFVHDMF
jgi:hypothetical protein